MKLLLFVFFASFVSSCSSTSVAKTKVESLHLSDETASVERQVERGVASIKNPVQKFFDREAGVVCYYIHASVLDSDISGRRYDTDSAYHGGHAAISCLKFK